MASPSPLFHAGELIVRYRVWLLLGLAGLFLFVLVWALGSYILYPGYLDHGEPSVTLISFRILDGVPAYPGFDEPGMVSNVYGPLTFVVHALAIGVLGPSVLSGKAASILAALLIPFFVFLSHYRRGVEAAAGGAIFAAGLILLHIPYSIWNRPDSIIALLGVIAVWAANASDPEKPEWSKSVLIALTGGLAVGFKIHAGIYFAPVVIFHCLNENRGIKAFMAMSTVGMAVVLLPFAFSVFSISNYLAWFGLIADKANPAGLLFKVVRYGLIYLIPGLFFLAAHRWAKKPSLLAEKVYFWVFFACLVAVIFPASKVGAGVHYYFPFLAIFIDQMFRHAGRIKKHRRKVLAGMGLAAALILILGIPVQKRFYRALHWQEIGAIQTEIRMIMAKYPDRTIEMGVGENIANYYRTFYKTLLVLEDHPYTLDAAVVMETSMMKIPLTDDTLAMIRGCNTDLWLIPRDERPFTMDGYYGNPMFDEDFLSAFQGSYAKKESLEFFDVWACSRPG